MGIYTDKLTILGVRILIYDNHDEAYYVRYEFSEESWRENAVVILPNFLGKTGIKIQTLHPFTSSLCLQSGRISEPSDIWLDNPLFKLEDILPF
jgi:hypothetical protein